MKRNSIIFTAVTLTGLLIGLGLVSKSRSIKIDEHTAYRTHLAEQHQHDLAVNQIVLETRYALEASYGPLAQELQKIQTLQNNLETIPDFLSDADTQRIQTLLDNHGQINQQRNRLTREFKLQNSRLKHSLFYLPSTVEDIKKVNDRDLLESPIYQSLTKLADKAVLYTLNPSEALAPDVQSQINKLKAYTGNDYPNLATIIDHGQIVLDNKPQVDKIAQELLALPTLQSSQALAEAYENAYETASKRSKRFQLASMIWFLSLLTGATYWLLRLNQHHQVEQITSTLFERIDDAFMSIDNQWNIGYVNAQAAKILEREADELVNMSFWASFPKELAYDVKDFYQRAIDQQTVITFERHYQKGDCWLEFRLYPRNDGLSVFWQDISTRKKAEAKLSLSLKITDEALKKAEAERSKADEANRAKSHFLANMSHELRTPLNAIIGYSEMLEEDAEDTGQEDFIPELRKIQGAGKHLLGLINNVLDLSKVESGCMEVYLETFEVFPLLQNVAATIQPLVEKNNNVLKLLCADNIGAMYADQVKVRQSLFNLLSNASKFTQNGVITLRAIATDTDNGSWIDFQVQDTGIGMTPTQLTKIFNAFAQADSSTTRKYGGTGLGLTITKNFIEMMGGDITVSSELNQGTTFNVQFPRTVQDVSSSDNDSQDANTPSLKPVPINTASVHAELTSVLSHRLSSSQGVPLAIKH